MSKYFALVPAAGHGARFGAKEPKQYLDLLGRPLIYHTLKALLAVPEIERVWVVLAPDDQEWARRDWSSLGPRLETLRCGGATRADTVRQALRAASMVACDQDWILVHDAARPCVTPQMIQRMMRELSDDPVGGLLAVPVADTLKRTDLQGRVQATESREGLWQAQTPQMFRYQLLQAALQHAPTVTDEASAVEALGHAPRLIASEHTNFKVTYPADLLLASLVLRGQNA